MLLGETPGDREDVAIVVDAPELAAALRALIENAGEPMAEGEVVRVRAREDGDQLHVEIEDHGPGIRPAVEETLFVPLRSTKPGHVGLGLGIARRVIQGYKGELSVRAEPQGVCASVDLPILPGGASSREAPEPGPPG